MLPRIGKTGGQQRPSSRSSAGRKTASAGRKGHARATVAVTDSEDSSFGESDDSPVKSTRARTVSAGKYQTPSRGVPRDDHEPGLGMSRQQHESESRGERVDRSRVEHDRTKPVVTKEQVFSMRNPAVDVSDSTGEDSEGDSMGKRALQQARNSRSKSRDRRGKSASRARTRGGDDEDENLGQVRTKYGVKVKVDKVDMDKYADFDHMVRAQTRDGRRATKDEDNRRTQQSAFATQVQREAMELQVEEELQELDDIASKRERWLLRNQERQLRAAEASKHQLSLKGVGLARMWLSQIRRPGPETWSPRAEVPGAGEEDYGGGSHDNLDMTRREDTGRQKLYHQSQLEIELYKKEISALADREDEQRRILKELWSQKAALQAKDEKYTQIVWEVRKHILEQKDELEKLTRRKGDAEHQLDMVYNEMEAFRAEGEVVKNRRMAALDEIGRMKEERAAQEEVEKEQLALLLRMRRAHDMRDKRNNEAHAEMEKLALQGVQQQQDYKDLDNKMLRIQEEMKALGVGLEEKEAMAQRLVEQKRTRQSEEQQGVGKVQLALGELDEQDKRIQAHREKENTLRNTIEEGVLLEAEAKKEAQFMDRMLQDPDRVRRREEAQANLAEAKTVQDTMDQSERAARLQLDRAMLALREAEFAHRRVLEEAATAEETTRKIDERREECLRRTLRFAADKEAAEERFQKQKDALVSAQHEEKMIEKREMQTRHDEQKVRARIAARAETISDIADTTQALEEQALEQQTKLDALTDVNAERQRHCDVLQGQDVEARSEKVRLIDLEEVERQKLADAQTDLARVAENLENAAGERATMQQELQATKKRLVEAYDEQLDKKRLIKKTAEDLDLQNTQLEEQKTKLKDMVDRRRAEESAVKAEMNKLRGERQSIEEAQKQWLKEAVGLRNEKDAAEKKSKQRAAEIERLAKLKEALDKKEPMQAKELERLNTIIQERENKEGERSKDIKRLREEIDMLQKNLGGERGALQELQRKKTELVGELQICSEDTGMTEADVEMLEMKLGNLGHKSDDFRVQKEALDHAIGDAAREGEMLQKQLRESEALRDAQVKALEDMTRTLAHAQADLTERTEALRESNDGKAVAEQHLRAEYERQKDRGKDLSDRALQLEQALHTVQSEVQTRTEQESELESKLKDMQSAADDGEARLQDKQDRLKQAEHRWENVEQIEATGLEKDLDEKLDGIKQHREKLQALKYEVAEARRSEAGVQDEMARDVRTKVDTDKQLERSRKDLHDMRAKLAPLLKEQLAAEEEIKRLTERKLNTDKLAGSQTKELEALRAGYRDAESTKRERETELLALRSRLNSKDFTAQEQVGEFERLQKEEAKRRGEIAAAMAKARAEWPEYSREERELREELETLRASVTEKKETVEALRDEAAGWRIKDEMLRSEEDALLEELSDAKLAAETWPSREALLKADTERLGEEILAHDAEEEDLTKSISDLTDARNLKRNAADGLKQKCQGLTDDIKDVDAKIKELDAQSTLLEKQKIEAGGVSEDRELAIAQLQKDSVHAAERKTQEEERLTERTLKLDEARRHHEESRAAIEQELAELTELEAANAVSLQDMHARRNALQHAEAAAATERDSLKDEAETLQESRLQAEKDIAEMQADIGAAREMMQATAGEAEQVREARQAAEEAVLDRKASMDKAKDALHSALQTVADCEETIEHLGTERGAMERKVAALQEVRAQLEAAHKGATDAETEHAHMLEQLTRTSEQRHATQQAQEAAVEAIQASAAAEEEKLLALSTELSRLEAQKAARGSRSEQGSAAVEQLRKETEDLSNGVTGLQEEMQKLVAAKEKQHSLHQELEDQLEKEKKAKADLDRKEDDRQQNLSRARAEREVAEQMEEEETAELEKLKQYAKQMKGEAATRIDELDTLRKHQREEDKRQREHENALDQLRKQKLEKEKRDLDHLQELEKLQREKERLDKRESDVNTQMDKMQDDIKEKKSKDKKKKKEIEDDAMSMMSDMTMDTQAQNEEPATALNDDEKDKWQSEGKSELDKKFFGIFSRSRHGRYQECERVLLTELDGSKVPVDCRDEFDNTPLIISAQNNKKRVAKLFLRQRADINAVNSHGNTCLHYCFTYGYGDLGDYLISKGANDTVKNKQGLTCYEGLDKVRQASAIRPSSKRK